jgi:hypothetical protein
LVVVFRFRVRRDGEKVVFEGTSLPGAVAELGETPLITARSPAKDQEVGTEVLDQVQQVGTDDDPAAVLGLPSDVVLELANGLRIQAGLKLGLVCFIR